MTSPVMWSDQPAPPPIHIDPVWDPEEAARSLADNSFDRPTPSASEVKQEPILKYIAGRALYEVQHRRNLSRTQMVDTKEKVVNMLQILETCTGTLPQIVVDCEGFNFYRMECDIIEIYHIPEDQLYLVDVNGLTGQVFNMQTPSQFSLEDYLESRQHPKLFFDCRNDARALHQSFAIDLRGVVDISLMLTSQKMLQGTGHETQRIGLADAVRDLYDNNAISQFEYRCFHEAKSGGRVSEAWARRPLSSNMIEYTQDLRLMNVLFQYMKDDFIGTPRWAELIQYSAFDARFGSNPRYIAVKIFRANNGAPPKWSSHTPWSPGYQVEDRTPVVITRDAQDYQAESVKRRSNGHAIDSSQKPSSREDYSNEDYQPTECDLRMWKIAGAWYLFWRRVAAFAYLCLGLVLVFLRVLRLQR